MWSEGTNVYSGVDLAVWGANENQTLEVVIDLTAITPVLKAACSTEQPVDLSAEVGDGSLLISATESSDDTYYAQVRHFIADSGTAELSLTSNPHLKPDDTGLLPYWGYEGFDYDGSLQLSDVELIDDDFTQNRHLDDGVISLLGNTGYHTALRCHDE